MSRFLQLSTALLLLLLTMACSKKSLQVSDVTYQSIRTTFSKPDKLPEDAVIATEYFIDPYGKMLVVVYNLTDEIITIDQTKSFLVNTNGESVAYYDPTVYSSTSGGFESSTSSTSFNLGAIANAFGIGGPLGSLLGGTTVSGSSTVGSFSSNTVTVVDQPQVRIGPRGRIVMSKQFQISNVGEVDASMKGTEYVDEKVTRCPLRFSVTISYSVEGNEALEKLTTDFYVNSFINKSVSNGNVSTAFTSVYKSKPDALVEPLYLFYIRTNIEDIQPDLYFDMSPDKTKVYTTIGRGSLIDYK